MIVEIFVVGSSRSGTHLISQLLSERGPCFMFHEIHFWENLADEVRSVTRDEATRLLATLLSIQRDGIFQKSRVEPYREEAARILSERVVPEPLDNVDVYRIFLHHEAERHGRSVPIEQTPRNLFFLETIVERFPAARVIVMERDPRDVLLSQREKWKMRSRGYREIPVREAVRTWSNYHPITVSLLWNAAFRQSRKILEADEADRIRLVRFEHLVSAPEVTLRGLCEWLGIPYDPEMLEISRWGSSHEERKAGTRGIDPSASERWRETSPIDTDLWWCERICAETMTEAGYAPGGFRVPFLARVGTGLTWPPKTLLALLLNLGRNESIVATVRRRLRALRAGD